MSAVLVGRFETGSPEWHEARRGGLGGSEIAAVLGLSPFESRFSLWHRKAGTIGPAEVTPEMEWGTRLEPAIAKKFFDEHPEYDPEHSNPAGTWTDSDRTWQIANPDSVVYEAGERAAVLETKFSLFGDGWGQAGTDQVPQHVRCQVIWYCDTLSLPVSHVAVLIGGHDYREYVIEYDRVEAEQLRAAARAFLHSLNTRQRPDIDAHGATYQTIRELHPDIAPDEVVLPNDLAHRYIRARHDLKAAEASEQQARSEVADVMGDAQRATWDGQVIARRQARGEGRPYVVAGRDLPTLKDDAA